MFRRHSATTAHFHQVNVEPSLGSWESIRPYAAFNAPFEPRLAGYPRIVSLGQIALIQDCEIRRDWDEPARLVFRETHQACCFVTSSTTQLGQPPDVGVLVGGPVKHPRSVRTPFAVHPGANAHFVALGIGEHPE